MKKRLILLSIGLSILSSCDPYGCLRVEIQNNTSSDIILKSYSPFEYSNFNDTIKKGNKILLDRITDCELGNIPELNFYDYDSIALKSLNNEILKIWKPGSNSKNIYKIEADWRITKQERWNETYLFEINESDLN